MRYELGWRKATRVLPAPKSAASRRSAGPPWPSALPRPRRYSRHERRRGECPRPVFPDTWQWGRPGRRIPGVQFRSPLPERRRWSPSDPERFPNRPVTGPGDRSRGLFTRLCCRRQSPGGRCSEFPSSSPLTAGSPFRKAASEKAHSPLPPGERQIYFYAVFNPDRDWKLPSTPFQTRHWPAQPGSPFARVPPT